jgi:hypothetical protein
MRTYLFLLSILVGSSIAVAAPEPTRANLPNIWTLNITFENPQQICVQLPGEPRPTRYWYMIITLTNNTGRDVSFYPDIWLVTDTFQSVQASTKAREKVFEQIRDIWKGRYPFLERFEFVRSKILQGSDNAQDLCVIFPDFDPEAKRVDIFIGGLSNETAVTYNPAKKDENGNPVKVVLQKTLELQYDILGDPSLRNSQTLKYVAKRWVMR